MPKPDQEHHVREAARIFLRLREDPDNTSLLAERDAYLAEGEAQRAAYDKLNRAWTAARSKPRPRRGSLVVWLLVCLTTLYFAANPVRVFLLADHQTGRHQQQVALASGDIADLDAGSAITDATDGPSRQVTLLEGAAFFDVRPGSSDFRVMAGPVNVQVLGTGFEVARLRDGVIVAVAEGEVLVTSNGERWTLGPGQRLKWAGASNAVLDTVNAADVAVWRRNQLVTDGMTFAEVAAIIDRRLPGTILITDSALAESSVAGGLDLTRPEQALRLLATVRGADVTSIPPLLTVVTPGE